MTKGTKLFKTCSVAGFTVLAVLFMSALAVAGPNRPLEVPEGYVITPFGYFHPSCALRVAEGETLLADGRVEHADGSVDASVPVCNYPHYTATGLLVTADTKGVSGADPTVNGWLEAIWATTATSYGKISATWTVPPPPNTNDGQTLFFFPGFEDYNDVISIVQPVLQFGPSAAGGGSYWAVASWNCCMNGIAWNSPVLNVNTGDTILGTITSTCKAGLESCAKWNVISEDNTTGKQTTLAKTPSEGQVWNWAFGAVAEVYGVDQCGDYPANADVVFTVRLYDQNRKLIANPPWEPAYAGSGTTPWCNYGLYVTAKKETLVY
jgi:hypothetical protein